MPPQENTAPAPDARSRILRAAAEVFAQSGYHDAGVREICQLAGANLAAVRYYFGSKLDLYREILISSHQAILQANPPPRFLPNADPEAALREWIGFFLGVTLTEHDLKGDSAIGQIMTREMRSPSPVLPDFVNLIIAPIHAGLGEIMRALVGPDCPDRLCDLLAFQIIALGTFHDDKRGILELMNFPPPNNPADIAELADFITEFALHGIRGLRHKTPQI